MIFQKISADEKSICDKCFHHGICVYEDNQPCFECTRFVDAVPVVHGRWLFVIKGQNTSAYACSECNRVVTLVCDEDKVKEQLAKKYPYCHCGAKMDLEVKANV